MSDLHVNEVTGLITHIRMLDERIGRLEMLVEQQGSGSYKYNQPVDWTRTQGAGLTADTDSGDVPGFVISPRTDGHFELTRDGLVIGSFPSYADAEKAIGRGALCGRNVADK